MDRGLGEGEIGPGVIDEIRQQARRVLVVIDRSELVEGKAFVHRRNAKG